MKHAVLLAVVLLASCAKEDRPVRYSATCDRCDLWYQSDAKTLTLASLDGSWNVFVADTVVTLVDTTYTIDSTRVLATWSIDVSLEYNARPTSAMVSRGSIAVARSSSSSATRLSKRIPV